MISIIIITIIIVNITRPKLYNFSIRKTKIVDKFAQAKELNVIHDCVKYQTFLLTVKLTILSSYHKYHIRIICPSYSNTPNTN